MRGVGRNLLLRAYPPTSVWATVADHTPLDTEDEEEKYWESDRFGDHMVACYDDGHDDDGETTFLRARDPAYLWRLIQVQRVGGLVNHATVGYGMTVVIEYLGCEAGSLVVALIGADRIGTVDFAVMVRKMKQRAKHSTSECCARVLLEMCADEDEDEEKVQQSIRFVIKSDLRRTHRVFYEGYPADEWMNAHMDKQTLLHQAVEKDNKVRRGILVLVCG